MTTIPPNAVGSGSSPTAPAAPASGATAVVTEMPTGLQNSGPGSVISGTVIGRDNHGQTLLQTDAGVVSFKTAVNLAVGALVTLQVQIAGSQLQAVILAARAPSVPVGGGLATLGTATAAAIPAATNATSIGQGPLVVATVIGPMATGTLPTPPLSGSAKPASSPGGQAPAPQQAHGTPSILTPAMTPAIPVPPSPAGAPPVSTSTSSIPGSTVLPATVSSVPAVPVPVTARTTPAAISTGTPLTTASTAATGATGNPSASPPQPAAAAGVPAALPAAAAIASYAASAATTPAIGPSLPPAGNTAVAILAAHPDADAQKSSFGLPSAATGTQLQMRYIGPADAPVLAGALVATVLSRTPAGQTVLDTALGRLALTLPAGVGSHREGSLLAFDVIGVSRPTPASAASAAPAQPLALGREWPALKAAMAVLGEADPALARQIMDVSLPRPGHPRFLGQVLAYIASASPDMRTLLGEAAINGLERAGRHDLVLRLDADLREAARANATGSDWRMYFVPILDANEMRQLRLFTRRRSPARDQEHEGGGRFVVEVEFDEIGPLQIDGLVQKPRLDLILRSHTDLPPPMRAGIADVFEKTCGAAGLNGQIFFQAVAAFPVSPLEEMARGSRPGVEV